jgi:hypothetical protein
MMRVVAWPTGRLLATSKLRATDSSNRLNGNVSLFELKRKKRLADVPMSGGKT